MEQHDISTLTGCPVLYAAKLSTIDKIGEKLRREEYKLSINNYYFRAQLDNIVLRDNKYFFEMSFKVSDVNIPWDIMRECVSLYNKITSMIKTVLAEENN